MHLKDSIMVRLISSEFIKNTTLVSIGYLSFPTILPFYKLSLLFDYLSSTYLFSTQLWNILEILFLSLESTFVL